jgi:oligopeptide transport system substrate-binding protein
MKKAYKLLALVLVFALSLVACSKKVEMLEKDDRLAAEAFPSDTTLFNQDDYTKESDELYAKIMGDFTAEYDKAKSAASLSERYAHMALAEAKMLGQGIFIPLDTRGGNYAIGKLVPKTISSVMWGNDGNNFNTALVTTEFLTPEDRDAVKAKFEELKGTGTFYEWTKGYLKGKGYELKDTYNIAYTADPQTWDILNTYRSADSEKIWPTLQGLVYYDVENVMQPGLAESYKVSDDGLTYTFKLRPGLVWVDSQGRKVADLTADDFVAGMQHLLDAAGGLESLVAGDAISIKNAAAYLNMEVTDFAEVGVKAIDDLTLEYTLEEPAPYFMSMLSYNIFAPLSRSYYESQGGKFGKNEFDPAAETYMYGTDPDHIAYCGAYVITSFTEKSTIVYKLNESFWNKDNVAIKKCTQLYNDGSDATKAYNDLKKGVIDTTGLNNEAVASAKKDGLFDTNAYVSDTDATTYCGFINVNRKAFANFNDNTKGVSEKTVYDAKRATLALQNRSFRRAFISAFDRGAYQAQRIGEDLKYTSIRNSYVPGTFLTMPEDVTVKINGKDTTFPAGTYYGEIMQAQIDADGYKIKVWDAENGTGDGFDGWYNPEFSKSELEKAIEELKNVGVEVTSENPIILDFGYYSQHTGYTNRANALKNSVESVTEGKIKINLVAFADINEWYYSGYYPDFGYEMNDDFTLVSGWGPDYGDPQTYLDTVLGNPGGMIKSCGLY